MSNSADDLVLQVEDLAAATSPPPPPPSNHSSAKEETSGRDLCSSVSAEGTDEASDDEYYKPLKRLCTIQLRPAPNPTKPLSSFFIKDILNHKPSARTNLIERGIVRPWDLESPPAKRRRPRSADDDSRSESDSPESPGVGNLASSPLDALFEMTSKAFDGLNNSEKSLDGSRDHLNLFTTRQQPKKKRKSRTAFTNHQIFELEKRFLYQKYLSPADRDEIAQSLNLTNAQVITWFQNRRAKLKRDMEELKKDVDAAKMHTIHKTIFNNIQDLTLLKNTELQNAHAHD
ncbi:transcription factor LBX2-like [Tachypleus tridentatus]|uniref:transcription factor LBX2-like n=1 Tax=Tachypleus tridentatus TaxID=6853 RepID=UPI003FD316D4